MSIGIHTRYQKHDATIVALSLAEWLKHRDGENPSLRARWWRSQIDPTWDSRIIGGGVGRSSRSPGRKRAKRHKAAAALNRWLGQHKTIIWTEPPDPSLIYQAGKLGVRSIIWTGWDAVTPDDEISLHTADFVVVPTIAQREHISKRAKLRHVSVAPYDPFLPITHKLPGTDDGNVRMLMTLWGTQLCRTPLATLLAAARVVHRLPNVTLTVACSKGISALAMREFNALQRAHGDRVRFIFDCQWSDQLLLMANHTITLWPAVVDAWGIVGLSSLYMGSPVFAFDLPTHAELLSNSINSVLVPCRLEYDWIGVPHAAPDYKLFESMLIDLCASPKHLASLTDKTNKRLSVTRDAFVTTFQKILRV